MCGEFCSIMNFWLFSLERYNGVLGEQPNNNECIELQLMRRFPDYNSQANLLIELINEESNPIADQFSLLSLNFYSISNVNSIGSKEKSLDKTTLATKFFSATKTTIANLDSSQICLLKDVYLIVYPTAVLIVSLYQHHVGECRELSLGGNCMYQVNTF